VLKEWAFKNLLSTEAGGGAGKSTRDPDEFDTSPELIEQILSRLESRSEPPMEGALIRASSLDRSPFLLEDQQFHKSVVLVLKDEEKATVGVVLNRVSTQGVNIKVEGGEKTSRIPLLYGGQYTIDRDPVLWLHCSSVLREANIGIQVGFRQAQGIWKCSIQEVVKAVTSGLAKAEDFLAVSGVHIWPKLGVGQEGIEGEIELGNFEMVPTSVRDEVWSSLTKQQILTPLNLDASLRTAEEAWSIAAKNSERKIPKNGLNLGSFAPLAGLGDNFDEEDDTVVFKSDYKVRKLCDDALRNWCAVFLLGIPDYNSL
jgi:putative AlgH/UPF0301 family transcriptional regulator